MVGDKVNTINYGENQGWGTDAHLKQIYASTQGESIDLHKGALTALLITKLLLVACGSQVNALENTPAPTTGSTTQPIVEVSGSDLSQNVGVDAPVVVQSGVVTDTVQVAEAFPGGEVADDGLGDADAVNIGNEGAVPVTGEPTEPTAGNDVPVEPTPVSTGLPGEVEDGNGADEVVQDVLDIADSTNLNFPEVNITAEGWPDQEIPNNQGFFDIIRSYLKMKGYNGSQLYVDLGRFTKGAGEQDAMLAEGYSVYMFADNALGILSNDDKVVVRFEISSTQSDDALHQPPIMLMLYSADVQGSDNNQVVTVDLVDPNQLSPAGKALLGQMQSYMVANQ